MAALPGTPPAPPGSSEEPDVPGGAIHRVQPGQTLWRIARAYGVPLDDLCRANGITDPDRLASGQVLFVPGATRSREVPPYPAPFAGESRPETGEEFSPRVGAAFLWPVPGGELLSPFAAPRRGHLHAGLDIRGNSGQEVLATEAGDVVFSGDTHGDYGRMVVVRHEGGLESLYAHGSKLLVQVGDRVDRGQPVALVGRTGNASTPHCHFEIRRGDVPVDPSVYLGEPAPATTSAGYSTSHGKARGSVTGQHARTGKSDER